jgi:hypothetical protein
LSADPQAIDLRKPGISIIGAAPQVPLQNVSSSLLPARVAAQCVQVHFNKINASHYLALDTGRPEASKSNRRPVLEVEAALRAAANETSNAVWN